MAKVMISVPDRVLAEIDEEARKRAMTRSGLLALAASHEIELGDASAIDAALARSRARFAQAPAFDGHRDSAGGARRPALRRGSP